MAAAAPKPYEIPFINLGAAATGGRAWRELSDKVRGACETHGCFCVKTEAIPGELRDKMAVALSQLFDLPEDTKARHVSTRPYGGYRGASADLPYVQIFAVDDAPKVEGAQAFTDLMWPQGNPAFCEVLNEMSAKMLELNLFLMNMIYTSFGLEAHLYNSYLEDNTSTLRLMKYIVPSSTPEAPTDEQGSESTKIGLGAHTDKTILTILSQNGVQGLEIQTLDGEWVKVMVPDGALIVVLGDSLKAWSNGRLHAVKHRVVVARGEKERYSWGMFIAPNYQAMIEVPKELVDEEHPLRYRPFTYADYMSYFRLKLSEDDALKIRGDMTSDTLESFAGVPPVTGTA